MYWYFYHWWNGDLAQFYHPLGYTIPQLNKMFKIVQYCTGLMAFFELVEFKAVMYNLRWVSFMSIFSYRFMNLLVNFWNLASRLVFATLLLIFRGDYKKAFKSAFWDHFWNAKSDAERTASSNRLVLALDWLERNPISPKRIKTITFILFAIFSLAELLTSV